MNKQILKFGKHINYIKLHIVVFALHKNIISKSETIKHPYLRLTELSVLVQLEPQMSVWVGLDPQMSVWVGLDPQIYRHPGPLTDPWWQSQMTVMTDLSALATGMTGPV